MYAIVSSNSDTDRVLGKLGSVREARAEILRWCNDAAEELSEEAAEELFAALSVVTLH